jgi:hypothetical protein
VERTNPDKIIVHLGDHEVFPAPLVRSGPRWRFDDAVGFQEIHSRRLRRNETAVVDVCRRYLEAQLDYAQTEHEPGGGLVFAQRIRATPGHQDGLYWANEGGDESPEGPLFAAAAFAELGPGDAPHPYFGYYFKILPQRWTDGAGVGIGDGSDGGTVTRFAMIAWPAAYGVSGVDTFLVNDQGEVYQKDMGTDTQNSALGLAVFTPGPGWVKVVSEAEGE